MRSCTLKNQKNIFTKLRMRKENTKFDTYWECYILKIMDMFILSYTKCVCASI